MIDIEKFKVTKMPLKYLNKKYVKYRTIHRDNRGDEIYQKAEENFVCSICGIKFVCNKRCLNPNYPITSSLPYCVCEKCQNKISTEYNLDLFREKNLCVTYFTNRRSLLIQRRIEEGIEKR